VQKLNAQIVPTYKGEPTHPSQFEKLSASMALRVGGSLVVGKDPKNGCFVLPGGKVNEGGHDGEPWETLTHAFVREVFEELGLQYIQQWSAEQWNQAIEGCTAEVANGARFGFRPVNKTFFVVTYFLTLPEPPPALREPDDEGKFNPLTDVCFLNVNDFFGSLFGLDARSEVAALLDFVGKPRADQEQTPPESWPQGYEHLYKQDKDVAIQAHDEMGRVVEGSMKAFVARTLVGSYALLVEK